MQQLQIHSPFPDSVLRAPSPDASCSCAHSLDCRCACHSPSCDPGAEVCDIGYLADDGGFTPWGCTLCTPGAGAPHNPGCDLIGWHVPMRGVHRVAG